jgi:hypothetical protein
MTTQPTSPHSEQATRDACQGGFTTEQAASTTREGVPTTKSIDFHTKSIGCGRKSIGIEAQHAVSTPKSIGIGAKQSVFATGWAVSVTESAAFATESIASASKSTDFALESTDFVTGFWPRAPPRGTHHPRLFTPAMRRVPCKRNDKQGRILLCNSRNASPT